MSLSSLFNPASIALVGASERSTWSRMAVINLRSLGFQGRVHLVSRSGGEAYGSKTFTSVRDIPDAVDVAVLMIPNASLFDALRDLEAAGIRYAIVLAGGFAETGAEGQGLQAEMVGLARRHGVTLLGPNSLGFINFGTGAVGWSGTMRTPPLKGHISIVSQSGAVATVVKHFAHQHGIGLNMVVATGNEAMLSLAEVMDYLVDDAATRVIALFIETVRRPDLFRAAAERALRAGKPVVVLKVGRSDIAKTAAQSHTASLVGDDDVFDGVCRQLGIVRVAALEELVFTSALMDKTGVLEDASLAVLSVSGGIGEMAADYAELEGLPLARLNDRTLAALGAVLPPMATPANPLDLTGAAVNNPDLFRQCLEAVQQDPAVKVLVCIYDVPTANDGDWQPFAVGTLEAVGRFKSDGRARFLLISNTVKNVSERAREEIAKAQLPYVACGLHFLMTGLRHAARWSARHLAASPTAAGVRAGAVPEMLPRSEVEVMRHLAACAVPVVPQLIAEDEAAAIEHARGFGWPVVLKIASADIAHKTEVGGVLLNLGDDAAVAEGFRRIIRSAAAAAPSARLEGVIVSPMRRGGLELFVGIRIDPQWGPVLALGLGGVWIEALNDVSLRPLPVTPSDVAGMVSELRGSKLLQGFRGSAAVDAGRLAEVVARIGDAALLLGPTLETLEINPLIADGERIEALDALATYTN
jgi:acyl-CoA synthetase (NDP forming)